MTQQPCRQMDGWQGRLDDGDPPLTTDPAATPEQLSALFGRKNAKRQEQIEGIIETLRGLGQV